MFKRFWWMFLMMVPVGLLLGFLVSAVVTYVMPKMYESEVVVEVKPSRAMKSFGTEVKSERGSANFFATEFEKIKSRNSLERVVESQELGNRWGMDKETAVQTLKRLVSTQNLRGTDLISIRVRHTDRTDARDIAVAVAVAYKDYRNEIAMRNAEKALQELNEAVINQEERVEERRKVLETFIREQGVEGGEDGGSQRLLHVKRELETDQELLKVMKEKEVAEKISINLGSDCVMIHEDAVIANSPVSPNVTLNLVIGSVLGLLLSPLMALPLMWIMNRLMPAKAVSGA